MTGRDQCVVLDGTQSRVASIISGVPQGTVLGPILFIVFINDLENCIKHSKARFFADDTRISKLIVSENDVEQLQEDLNNVITWSQNNNMKLHEDKFELMVHLHDPKNLMYELPFVNEYMSYEVSNGNTLQPTPIIRDLGVIVSSDISWTPHITKITCKARAVSSWICSVFRTRDRIAMLTLYKSLVRSILEFCCPLWNPHSMSDIRQL